jgi:hypothetical protein
VKTCAYCGHENEDSCELCAGCGESLIAEEPSGKFLFPLTGKSPNYRRKIAAIGNVLAFLIGALKFRMGSASLISFSTVAPIISFGCVWYGVNHRRLTEAAGWILLVALAAMHLGIPAMRYFLLNISTVPHP